jgi:hypothetical protein
VVADEDRHLPGLPGADRPDRSGGRELAVPRRSMSDPQFALEGKKTGSGVTNIWNTKSPRWLGPEPLLGAIHKLLGAGPAADGRRSPAWFAFDESRPLAVSGGI